MGFPSGGYRNPSWLKVWWTTARIYLARKVFGRPEGEYGTTSSMRIAAASFCLVLLAAAGFVALYRAGDGDEGLPAPGGRRPGAAPPAAGGSGQQTGAPSAPASPGSVPGDAGGRDGGSGDQWRAGGAPSPTPGVPGAPGHAGTGQNRGAAGIGADGTGAGGDGGGVPGGTGGGQDGGGGSANPPATGGPDEPAPVQPTKKPAPHPQPSPSDCDRDLLALDVSDGVSLGLGSQHDDNALLTVCH